MFTNQWQEQSFPRYMSYTFVTATNCRDSWSLRWTCVRRLPGATAHWQRNSPREYHTVVSFEYSNTHSTCTFHYAHRPAHNAEVTVGDICPFPTPTWKKSVVLSMICCMQCWYTVKGKEYYIIVCKTALLSSYGDASSSLISVFSLLTTSDGSKKVPADQISVTSSGSSGSEMEDLSSPNSACSIRLQVNRCLCACVCLIVS